MGKFNKMFAQIKSDHSSRSTNRFNARGTFVEFRLEIPELRPDREKTPENRLICHSPESHSTTRRLLMSHKLYRQL